MEYRALAAARFSTFLVNRRMDIRIVRFWRSPFVSAAGDFTLTHYRARGS
jgi:hypothetical protein